MATMEQISKALTGKIRGKAAAISLFYDEIPESYQGRKIDPCGIVRHAMDLNERVYVDHQHQDCISGAYTAGFHEGSEATRTGLYIFDNIKAYTRQAAARIKSGANVLPQGMVKGIGAAPVDDVPEGVEVHWICVVTNPYWAGFIGGARTVVDGTAPRSSCGISFCADLFASPFHDENVVVTPGDTGGRMNNKLKQHEMFVVIPMKYTDSMLKCLEVPDAKAVYETIKPEDSDYWVKKRKKEKRERARQERSGITDSDMVASSSLAEEAAPDVPAPAAVPEDASTPTEAAAAEPAPSQAETADVEEMDEEAMMQPVPPDMKLPFSMTWTEDAEQMLRKAPRGIVEMAISNVEDFADEHGHDVITRDVIVAQMEDVGMDPAILEDPSLMMG